jgi:hypothetical protein
MQKYTLGAVGKHEGHGILGCMVHVENVLLNDNAVITIFPDRESATLL